MAMASCAFIWQLPGVLAYDDDMVCVARRGYMSIGYAKRSSSFIEFIRSLVTVIEAVALPRL